MILAAISFADPLMLAGLLAALVPVLLHLLNRMRAPVVPFPTLRFLRITAQKTARRRQIQQYFLLLARVLVFALIAMAVAAPLIRGGSAGLAYEFVAMLLGGLVLLVLAGVMGAAAMDSAKAASRAPTGAAESAKRRGAAPYWSFSLAALLAAVLLGGYSAYGLISDRFFAGDKGEFSGRSTAAVIILDNSYSMLATEDSRTRLARAKEQVRQLLGESIRPAEAAILPTNPGDSAAAASPLTTDSTRLLGYLDKLNAQGSARPMQERIRTALDMLRGSSQPTKMLIIVSDFARPAFADAEVFAALKALPWRNDLQLVVMPIRSGTGIADAGVASFSLAEGTQRPAVGAELIFEAQILNNNDTADVRDLVFTIDGKPDQTAAGGPLNPRVQLGPAGSATARATVRIPYRPTQPGWHRFGIELQGNGDAMAWDDRRELALDIADQVPVLVVGAESAGSNGRPRARSAAFYFLAALAPFEGRAAGTAQILWSIKPTYRAIDELRDAASLNGNAAVFLCDLPKITAPFAGALQAFAQAGGRIVWVLGPSIDAPAYNQTLLADGRDLLPAPLDQPLVSATAWPMDWVDLHAGLFMNLYESQEPFRALLVTGRWSLRGELTRGRVLAKLSDGAPLCIQHNIAAGGPASEGGGGGAIYTLLTSPAAAWSNLGATSLLVPLASRMALGDFADSHNQADIETGRPLTWHAADIDANAAADPAALRGVSLDITLPDGAILNVKPAIAGTSPLWTFDRTFSQGLYRWKTSDARHEGVFVVNQPGDETDLLPADVEALARESSPPATTGGKPTIVATGAADLLGQLERRSEGTSLTPGFVTMVLILAVVEMLMANRHRVESVTATEPAAA